MLRDIRSDLQQLDNDGVLYAYSTSRSKWLSVARPTYTFSLNHRNVSGTRYLKIAGGVVSQLSGYKLPRQATLTSVTVETGQIDTGTFRVQVIRSGSQVLVYTASLTAQKNLIVTGLNLDFNAGDAITAQLYSGQFDYPVLMAEIAWRL